MIIDIEKQSKAEKIRRAYDVYKTQYPNAKLIIGFDGKQNVVEIKVDGDCMDRYYNLTISELVELEKGREKQ